ncbi:ABC transporter ATP-binding protein [Propionibacteriaceae bacterium Y2011]
MNPTSTVHSTHAPGAGSTVVGAPTSNPGDLEVRGVTHRYRTHATAPAVLSTVNLAIPAGSSVAVMGPSGSGKTTLLHLMAGVLRPSEGSITWRGQDLAAMSDRRRTRLRRADFGFVFQSGQLLPELPAEENAALPLMLGGTSRTEAVAHVRPILQRLGLAGMTRRRPGELSGGQAQRVAIARALAGSPGVIFTDEPTGALDSSTGAAVMHQLVAAAAAHGATLVVVTHDAQVAGVCSRTITLHDGRIIADHAAGGAR